MDTLACYLVAVIFLAGAWASSRSGQRLLAVTLFFSSLVLAYVGYVEVPKV